MNIIKKQIANFSVFNPNAKRLLRANALFGFVIPFYIIFSNTFIFSNTGGDIKFNILYSALHFLGNPLGFILNGYLLRKFHVKNLFSFGMLIIILNMTIMVFLPNEFFTEITVLVFGIVSGLGSGMYWSARNYLTVVSTDDESRDFFSGLDYVFFIAGGIVTPAVVGNYIGLGTEWGWFSKSFAYQTSILFAASLIVIAIFIVVRGNFSTVKISNFLHYKFDKTWNKTRWFVFIMGIYHGAILSIPAITVMSFVGDEKAVGIVDSIAHVIALIAIYTVSSRTKSKDREKVMTVGFSIFLIGTLVFTGFVGNLGSIAAISLVVAFYLSDPTMNFPYRATFMKSVDELKAIEGRDEFTYIVDIEQFNALGRIVSIGAFFILFSFLTLETAVSAFVIIVAIIQFFNMKYARKINAQ